jgi:hypothetical protein
VGGAVVPVGVSTKVSSSEAASDFDVPFILEAPLTLSELSCGSSSPAVFPFSNPLDAMEAEEGVVAAEKS